MKHIVFPKHNRGLIITHNDHKNNYITFEQIIAVYERYELDDFVSQEDMIKCIETDDVWIIQWYPNTTVGFHTVCASTFELALKKAMEVDDK